MINSRQEPKARHKNPRLQPLTISTISTIASLSQMHSLINSGDITEFFGYLSLLSLKKKKSTSPLKIARIPFFIFSMTLQFAKIVYIFPLFYKHFSDLLGTFSLLSLQKCLLSTVAETRSEHVLSLTIGQSSFPRHRVIVFGAKLPTAF